MRKTGQTTRLVNHYIQKMIDNPGQSYQIVDHYNDVHNNAILVKCIEHRLQFEYSNKIDITHSMDNYGKQSTGINKMSVRYSPYVLNGRDIFIGRFVDKIIEALFTHINEQVEVYQYIKEVYNENKLGYPTINIEFVNKIFEFVKGRLRHEHKLDPIKLLSIDYSLEKNNEYIVLTLYTNEFLEDTFSLGNKTKTRIDDMEMFSNVGVYNVDAVKTDNFDEYISDCINTAIANNVTSDIVSSIHELSGCITTVKDSFDTFSVSTTGCVDVIDELKNEIEKLKNKDKYKMPDSEIKINKMNMFK